MAVAEDSAKIRELADDLDRYYSMPVIPYEMVRAVGVELAAIAQKLIATE